jgi:PIN domain nuclease of toxin-antitoxin system
VRVLVDTHVFLWCTTNSAKLKSAARKLLSDAEVVYVSAASIWEVAIKSSLGKIDADAAELAEAIEKSGFRELPINAAHAARVARLPRHHGDPFDRLLLAQALTEPLILVTADDQLRAYGEIVQVV